MITNISFQLGLAMLRPIILTLLAEKVCRTFDMAKAIRKHYPGLVKIDGQLFPIMKHLVNEKMVTSYWNENGGHPRKFYQLSKLGMQQLEQLNYDANFLEHHFCAEQKTA
jgi:DNA-binding PadR family transcriptional regulator